MSLAFLVILVVLGIGLVIGLVHLTGGSRQAVIGDEVAAVTRFQEDHEDAQIVRCFLAADRFDALLILADGDVGFVHAFGSKALTRRFSRAELADMIEMEGGTSIALKTGELALPRYVIHFADQATRAEVMAALGLAAAPLPEPA